MYLRPRTGAHPIQLSGHIRSLPLDDEEYKILHDAIEKIPSPSRLTLHHTREGFAEEVPEDRSVGLDEMINEFTTEAEFPTIGSFSAWQGSDEDHPPGHGKAGYRIVYKALRLIPTPRLQLTGPNFKIEIGNGEINSGKAEIPGSLVWRDGLSRLIPEWGALSDPDDSTTYVPKSAEPIHLEGKEHTYPPSNYIEFLLMITDETEMEYSEQLTKGRMQLAPMLASLDLLFGERLLGPVLTEEVGTIFEDWHWNRRLGGAHFLHEPQARLKYLPTDLFMESFSNFASRHSERNEVERARVRTASQWYLQAKALPDPLMKVTAFWLCSEALELDGRSTNITPIKKTLENLFESGSELVIRLAVLVYTSRSEIVHGKTSFVDPDIMEAAQLIAEVLLEKHLLGSANLSSSESLLELATKIFR